MDMSLTLRPLKASESTGNYRGQGQLLGGLSQHETASVRDDTANLRHETASDRPETASYRPETASEGPEGSERLEGPEGP